MSKYIFLPLSFSSLDINLPGAVENSVAIAQKLKLSFLKIMVETAFAKSCTNNTGALTIKGLLKIA
jgi:hypothetical protein